MDWTRMQAWLATEFLGNTLQNHLVAVGVFVAVFLGLPILKAIVVRQFQALSKRTANDFDDLLVQLLRRHVGVVVYFFTALYLATLSLELPQSLQQILHTLFVIVITFKVVNILESLSVYGLTKWTERAAQSNPSSRAMIKNMTQVVRLALWSAGTLFVFDNLGINITTFMAGLGIGGVAIALAAQALLGDAFSSFAIFMDKPFEVGDFIIVGDLLGTVEDVGFKTTRIRSLGGEQIIFSNSDLIGSRVRNYKRMKERRVLFQLGVIYQTTHEQAKAIPGTIERVIKEHTLTRFDRAHFARYGDFALIFEIVYYVLSPDYNQYMDVQQFINLRIMEEFKQAGIEFAYPTQQLFITNVEHPT